MWLQIALAGGLGRAGAGAAGIINGGLSGAALQKTKQSGRNVSKGVLTAMSVKIPITKLLKMAILHEASVITDYGCCYVES
jgi:hypothetical protein